MAMRQTPEQFWKTSAKVQTQEPVLVQHAYVPPPTLQFPELNSTGMFVLGLVAVVGLVGLFAVLAFTSRKCDR